MQPFFSIVTVCLNAGYTLTHTIESALNQKYQDFEIIVKDGFSTDGSFEKVPEDNRIIKIQNEDAGIYDAMNQALNYAKGRYLLFLNADDIFYDDTVLQTFYYAIVGNDYPHLVYCDYMTTDLGVYVQNPTKLTNFFLFRTTLCHQVCMIQRENYDNLKGFDSNLKVFADWDFLIRLSKLDCFTYKHIQLLGIVYSSGGFSFQNRKLANKEIKIVRKKNFFDSYYVYYFFLLLTMPGLRNKVASGNGFASKFYQRVVNFYKRIN